MFIKIFIKRIIKIFNYRIINPIIIWSNNKNTPIYIYCFLFFFGGNKTKNTIKVEPNSLWLTITNNEGRETLYWTFYNDFRTRSRSHYNQGLRKRGFEIAETYNLPILDFKKDDIILDCGANNGDLWLYFYFLKIDVKYFAIEPGQIEYNTLKRNLKNLNKSSIESNIFKIGLGELNKKTQFFYSPNNADSSIIKPTSYSSVYTIDVLTLDSFIEKNKLENKRIKLLKLEAEGYEFEIIIGAIKTIKNIEYISADLGPERGEMLECTLPQVTNFLLKNSFEIKSINKERLTVLFKNLNVL